MSVGKLIVDDDFYFEPYNLTKNYFTWEVTGGLKSGAYISPTIYPLRIGIKRWKIVKVFSCIICNGVIVSAFILLFIVQDNDGATAVPVSAHTCICTDIVFATIDCSATANLLDPSLAK